MRKILSKSFLPLFSVVFFFGAAELICRLMFIPNPQKIYDANIFEYDKDKIFTLKKNLTDGQFVRRMVRTNSFGYRDTEIPVQSQGRHRILVVGDSISFGHGVNQEEAYPEVLETALNSTAPPYFDVINTSVPGNSPFQEYYDLKRGLIFKPDIAIIQFVLNDLTAPFKVLKKYGGTGKAFPRISEDALVRLLSRNSSFYLVFQNAIQKTRFLAFTESALRKKAIQKARNLDWNVAAHPPEGSDERGYWQELFKWYEKKVSICKSNNIHCILLLSYVDFQLLVPERRYAQKVLKEFALKNNIDCIDLLPIMEEKIRKEMIEKHNLPSETPFNKIASDYSEEVERINHQYFLSDYDHYSVKGHIWVADVLNPAVKKIIANR